MQKLVEMIEAEGRYLGNSILKVDSFLNHQVDAGLMENIGRELFSRLSAHSDKPITKILTAEASGILPALTAAMAGNCRLIYARKSVSKTMVDSFYTADAVSRTRGNDVTFYVNSQFLTASDNVLIIEDFLATGSSIAALVDIVKQSGAQLAGIGTVIEKPSEQGRVAIRTHLPNDCPIASLARIHFDNDTVATELGRLVIEKQS